jgi:hypothetical protein
MRAAGCARIGKLAVGRIDRNLGWSAWLDEQLGESAVAAADVDPS